MSICDKTKSRANVADMTLKMADWEEHRTHVTPREHKKYLGI